MWFSLSHHRSNRLIQSFDTQEFKPNQNLREPKFWIWSFVLEDVFWQESAKMEKINLNEVNKGPQCRPSPSQGPMMLVSWQPYHYRSNNNQAMSKMQSPKLGIGHRA